MTSPTATSAPTFVPGETPDGDPIVSLLLLRRYALTDAGRCEALDEVPVQLDVDYYPDPESDAKVQASRVRRDSDLFAFRAFTDLVVQGVARSDEPVAELEVALSCRGDVVADWSLLVRGDRRLERRGERLLLPEPQPFNEMVLGYDRAYGGTDDYAERQLTDADEEALMLLVLGELENRQLGTFSYPRNPAGRGYAVTQEQLDGMLWPNIEWRDAQLAVDERLVLPQGRWGERPAPAGFDFYPHAWFPRVAFFGEFAETEGDGVPSLEVELGLLPSDLRNQPLVERPKHGFAQCAHPFLQRSRLSGDELLTATCIGRDGAPLLVELPGQRPSADIVGPDGRRRSGKGALDMVLVQAEERWVELLWRVSVPIDPHAALSLDWRERCSAKVSWR